MVVFDVRVPDWIEFNISNLYLLLSTYVKKGPFHGSFFEIRIFPSLGIPVLIRIGNTVLCTYSIDHNYYFSYSVPVEEIRVG